MILQQHRIKTNRINTHGISCVSCFCKRQSHQQETKPTKENTIVTTNIVEDRRGLKFGGRNVSPDENSIFKSNGQLGSVETCDAGWGQTQITPKKLAQRREGTETDIEAIKKDIQRLESKLNEQKFNIMKKYVHLIYGLLIPQQEQYERKPNSMTERKAIRMYNAILSAI